MDRFVHEQNLAHYVHLLEVEADASGRASVQALLIEEAERFGSRKERLHQAELLIRQSEARRLRQEELITELDGKGRDVTLAKQVLGNMTGLLGVLRDYRLLLADEVERSHPSRSDAI